MSLEVIGAGFGRTGTLSMKVALETLGYDKTHHMRDVMGSSRQINLWHRIGNGEAPDWDEVFAGYRASVDFPSSTYYAELLDHYPEAKVVLTVRDFDRWYPSASNTIFRVTEIRPDWLDVIPPAKRLREMTNATVWDRVFDGRFSDREHARHVFDDHIRKVKATVPADQLLVFEVKEGWGPLCDFLGKPVPDQPFPHLNDSKSFQRAIQAMQALRALPYVSAGAAALVASRLIGK